MEIYLFSCVENANFLSHFIGAYVSDQLPEKKKKNNIKVKN